MERKKNKSKRWLFITLGAIVLVLFIGKALHWFGGPETTAVSVQKVTKRNITEVVSASGKVQPEVEVKLSSDVSGEITELYVQEGDSVQQGQLLGLINPDLYQTNLQRSMATLDNTKANLANAKAQLLQFQAKFDEAQKNYDRNQKLFNQKVISESEFESFKSIYLSAKASLESAKQNIIALEFTVKSTQAGVEESQKNLSRTRVVAPVSGTISKLNVEKGERVVGTSQMAGTEILRIANLNEMEMKVDVSESDIAEVKLGDSAHIELDAFGTRKFRGIVTEIANSANTTVSGDQVTNFSVKIRILRSSYLDLIDQQGNNKYPLRPGLSGTVEIETRARINVLSVPIKSVTSRSEETPSSTNGKSKEEKKEEPSSALSEANDQLVFVVNGETVAVRKVKTGIQDDTFIEITDGLKEGDQVVDGPYLQVSKFLKDGQKVKITDPEKLFKKP